VSARDVTGGFLGWWFLLCVFLVLAETRGCSYVNDGESVQIGCYSREEAAP
jgi:hypothetical protein